VIDVANAMSGDLFEFLADLGRGGDLGLQSGLEG